MQRLSNKLVFYLICSLAMHKLKVCTTDEIMASSFIRVEILGS